MQKESTARGELLEVFREELRELVNYKAGERLGFAKLTCLDVFFAYRMLLGRNPEFEDVARFREWQSVGTPAELFNQMIKTPEYVARIPGGGGQLLDLIVMHELPNGLRLFFNLQDRQAMRIATGIHEPEIIEAVRRVLKPGMNCVDAGAHIGMYALEMAKIVGAGGGKVYAFEPFPSTWELFIKNVAENHFEEVIVATKAGCHYDSGSAQIFNPISDDMGGAFIPKDAEIANASGLQGFRIELVRADSIVPDDRKIDLVKMDIEGSEPFALRGMERFESVEDLRTQMSADILAARAQVG